MGILNLNHRVIWICEPMWGVLFVLIIYHKQRWARHLARTTLDLKFWSLRKLWNSDAFSTLFNGQNLIYPWYPNLKKVGEIWMQRPHLIKSQIPAKKVIHLVPLLTYTFDKSNNPTNKTKCIFLIAEVFIFINFTSRPHFVVGGEAPPPSPSPLPTD